MGIKGLSKFLKTYIPTSISEKKISELASKYIAVDANYFMYKYTISSNDYINKFKKQYEHLVSNNIKAFYVFDGKPPKEKKKVIEKRKEVNRKKNIDVSVDKIKELKTFFNSLDIEYIDCESEADFICCKLCENGIIHGCISDDMDFLTLGCNKLYRDYYQHSDYIMEYDREEILKHFNKEQFIDICIFLGCDYCERVHDFVNRAIDINVYELFKTHETLENVWKYLRDNDMFLFVDDEKEQLIQEKWPKTREILNNDIIISPNLINLINNISIEKYSKYLENRAKVYKPPSINIKEIFGDPTKKREYHQLENKRFIKTNNFSYFHKKSNSDNWDKKNYKEHNKTNQYETLNRFDALVKSN